MTTFRTHSVRAGGMDRSEPSLLRRAARPALVLATTLALGGAVAASPAAAADPQPNSCDASALQLSLLGGAPLDPIHANPPFTPCVNADGTLINIPSLLGLVNVQAVEATTRVTPNDHAVSAARITGLKVGVDGAIADAVAGPLLGQVNTALNGVLGQINTVPLVGPLLNIIGLQATGTSGSGLLASLTSGLTSALPNVVSADVIDATAQAKCVSGSPQLSGGTQIAGLNVLGTAIDPNSAAAQLLTIDTANLNVGQLLGLDGIQKGITLTVTGIVAGALGVPSGTKMSVYQLLHQPTGLLKAVDSAISLLTGGKGIAYILDTVTQTLQPVLNAVQLNIPPGLLNVQVTPNAHSIVNGTLTESALWLNVTVLNQPILGGALAQARVGAGSPGCAPPKTPEKPGDNGQKLIKNPDKYSSPEAEALLKCDKNPLTLIDVVPSGSRALVTGIAEKKYVGKTATIYLQHGKKKVGTTKVKADGTFSKRVRKPAKSIRSTNKARYYAVVGGKKTKALKYQRRMENKSISAKKGTVRMSGRVIAPRFKKQPTIVVRYRKSCKHYTTVKRIKPNSKGHFTAKFKAPKGVGAAVYRAQTYVPSSPHGVQKHPTYTLPRVVGLY